jgi:putative ABC transport system substrate-binding protein
VKRREFITLLGGGAAGWPLAARAQQQAKTPRIGFLGLAFERTAGEWLRAGLRDLGYIEGINIIIEWQWAQNVDELPALVAELVRIQVDVIFAPSSTFVEAARQATTTIPIVFAVHADPVGLGHVAALARPGGNITGTSMLDKRVEGRPNARQAFDHRRCRRVSHGSRLRPRSWGHRQRLRLSGYPDCGGP